MLLLEAPKNLVDFAPIPFVRHALLWLPQDF
jgi:hypothetical protein